jgi:hypothetical protein
VSPRLEIRRKATVVATKPQREKGGGGGEDIRRRRLRVWLRRLGGRRTVAAMKTAPRKLSPCGGGCKGRGSGGAQRHDGAASVAAQRMG